MKVNKLNEGFLLNEFPDDPNTIRHKLGALDPDLDDALNGSPDVRDQAKAKIAAEADTLEAEIDKKVSDYRAKNPVPASDSIRDRLKWNHPDLFEEAVSSYRKFANLTEDADITEVDEWALNEAAFKTGIQKMDLRKKLLGEEMTLDQAARAIDAEVEIANDKTTIERELDQSLRRALWMQKRDVRNNFPNKLFVSMPGAGKTSIIYQWAKANNVNIIYKDCKTIDMSSLGGILTKPTKADDPYAGRLGTKEFHVLDQPRSVLFLDELNRAPANIQGSLLTLIADHTVWDPNAPNEVRYLPNFLFTIGAINPPSFRDPALKPLGTAMQRRFKNIHITANPMETLRWMRGYYGKLIEAEDDAEMLKELKGKLAIAEAVLSDPRFTYDTTKDEDAHADDTYWNATSPATFTDLLENSNGTKDNVIREWNNYCSYEKKDLIEDILRDYKDIDDKANDAIKDDSESEVFAAANDVRSRLRKLHPDLNV